MHRTSRRRLRAALTSLACGLLAVAAVTAIGAPARAVLPAGGLVTPIGHRGQWLTDAQGRAVVLHGLNQVYKVAPYTPSSGGFGDDDAAFLQANGFTAMRVGVIWAAVEPAPGVYDNAYLDSIASTVATLGAHGIVSLLDFHQDLFNEKFQGEGAPAWAVRDIGLPNPPLGFPFNYFANPAEQHAWDAFWVNVKASDGVGLQDHYAAAWKHVAQRFAADGNVLGYDLLNEPWPGTVWQPCLAPVVGCPVFDSVMTKFYKKVVAAIRTADSTSIVWIEPNVLNAQVDSTAVGPIPDPNIGWSFHDYCGPAAIGLPSTPCVVLDRATINSNKAYTTAKKLPWLLTEFGATMDTGNLSEVVGLADQAKLGWLEWAYTGNDITSQDGNGQALVLDPSLPPTGTNVVAGTLKALAEPYPQVVAGTPSSWSFSNGVFVLSYSTVRVGGLTRFPAGSETDVATPAVQFPHGYTVNAVGATVASAPGASTLRLVSVAGAGTVTVTVRPLP